MSDFRKNLGTDYPVQYPGVPSEQMQFPPSPENPFQVFPEEIWRMIVNTLEDSRDALSLLRANQLLNDAMVDVRDKLQFPLVMKLVASMLTENEFNNLRLVCKMWKKGIDEVYEKSPHGIRFKASEATYQAKVNPGVVLKTNNHVLQFHQNASMHQGNPFVGRRLTVDLQETEGYHFWRNLNNLLDEFGNYVWFLKYMCHDTTLFRNCVMRTPNVRAIYLDYSPDCEDFSWGVQEYLEENPLPRFPYLTILHANNFDRDVAGETICMQHAAQLNYVVLENPWIALDKSASFLINLDLLGGNCSITGLHIIAQTAPPLKTLKINVTGLEDNYVAVDKVFECLKCFTRSLLNLRLSGNFSDDYDDMLGYQLGLSNLTKMKISFYKGPVDPFISCKKLVHFSLEESGPIEKWNKSSMAYFTIDKKGDLVTNIWSLMPTLRKLRIPIKPYCNIRVYVGNH
ncbi:unnamed protein product [Orchesella dallaii]|uniref:F-box domain-containing protein n=1 Tax=Orchesella dallaii TaxID=48710 RepID=A0ABP1Q856_9HEXA